MEPNSSIANWVKAFLIAGFIITSGFGVAGFFLPDLLVELSLPNKHLLNEGMFNPYFIRVLCLVLIPLGSGYLIALFNEPSARSIIFILTLEKALVVLYTIIALIKALVLPVSIGIVLGDGALCLAGIYYLLRYKPELFTENDFGEEE